MSIPGGSVFETVPLSSPAKRDRRRPPSLFQSTPTVTPMLRESTHSPVASVVTPLQSISLPPPSGIQPLSLPLVQTSRPSSTVSTSTASVSVNLVKQELRVGPFVVTTDGCTSMRNHLLINRRGHYGPAIPATPPLKSTRLEEPISPLVYSNDEYPTGISETSVNVSPELHGRKQDTSGGSSPQTYPTTPHHAAMLLSDLQIKEEIDRGASGIVFRAIHKGEPQKLFAVKRIDLSGLVHPSFASNPKIKQLHHIVYRELQMLHSEYRSAHVVKIYNAFFYPEGALDIVMEFMHYGSLVRLGNLISDSGAVRVPLPERMLAVIAEQILHGLRDMHGKGYVHRDIKPTNILVNNMGIVKLSDFGLAEKIETIQDDAEDGLHLFCSGTEKYMSPERQMGNRHGPPSDIWALGMTLAECATGAYPVDVSACADGFERMECMQKVASPENLNADLSSSFKDFVSSCMRANPDDRPSAENLLEHEWLSRWQGTFSLGDCLASAIRNHASGGVDTKSSFLERGRRILVAKTEKYLDKVRRRVRVTNTPPALPSSSPSQKDTI